MFKALPRSFYEPSAEVVAPTLLGQWLIRQTAEGPQGGPIVETEAYLTGDPAAHSFVGPTDRNRVMFGPPGHCYVYYIYGNHYCVNAVCQPAGSAEAVLIRAIEAEFGVEEMKRRRPLSSLTELTNGPGKLCQALNIQRACNGLDLCDPHSPLFIAANPKLATFRRVRGPVVTTIRIGITKAADRPLRFYLAKSQQLSRRHRTGTLS